MARIPDTHEQLVRAARFQLALDPPPDLEEAIQKTAHISDEQLRPVLLKLVTDAVERKEPAPWRKKMPWWRTCCARCIRRYPNS